MANTFIIGLQNNYQSLAKLCKLKVVTLMLITAMTGMALTPQYYWNLKTALCGLLGIGFASCAGGIINQILETPLDAQMRRTQSRPLIQETISLYQAQNIAIIFIALSILILGLFVNILTMYATILTMFGYSWFYTKVLKPNTSQNIVIGGLFGAMPPLLGASALTNTISIEPLTLVLIIYTWTPPHFWALAIARQEDFKQTNLPMLPVTHGIKCTQISIIGYTIILILCTQLPYLLRFCSNSYFIVANLLNTYLLYHMIAIYKKPSPQICLKAFKASNIYLLALFFTILINRQVLL